MSKPDIDASIVDEAARRGVTLRSDGKEHKGLCPFHDDRDPSFTVYTKNGKERFKCFACSAAGDVIDFVMMMDGLGYKDALARLNGDDPTGPAPVARDHRVEVTPDLYDAYPPIMPVPETTATVHAGRKVRVFNVKHTLRDDRDPMVTYTPRMVFPYRDGEGRLLGYVLRLEFDGTKITPSILWCRRPDGSEGWTVRPFPEPRPLYGLERLASEGQVIITEGEKCADAAGRLLRLPSISWPGGGHGVGRADWSPLAGKSVVIWPDADGPGLKAAHRVAQAASAAGAKRVKVIDVFRDFEPAKGWDVADAEVESWERQDVLDWLKKRALEWSDDLTLTPPPWEPEPDPVEAAEPCSAPPEPPPHTEEPDGPHLEEHREGADHGDGWPALDLQALISGRADPPILPLDLFGPVWANWIATAAEGASAPPDYVVAALLPTVATLIGTARRVSPWPDWSEPSILWCGAVGDPSAAKSPAADPIMRALRAVEHDMAADHPERLARWRADSELALAQEARWKAEVKEAAKLGTAAPLPPGEMDPGPEPKPPRIVVSDTTPEAMADVLAANPRGLLTTRDELAGWLESFERYTGGSSRALWIEAFGARPYTIDRVKSGQTRIPALSVSIHGTTQPDRLVELLRGADDGLASRFLWTWPDPIPPRRPSGRTDRAMLERAFGRLLTLAPDGDVPVMLPVDDAGCDALDAFREQAFRDTRTSAGMMASASGKAPGLVLRLALALEHMWWSAGNDDTPPALVSVQAVHAACALWMAYFRPMAARVYGDAALPRADRDAVTLARAIRSRGAREINLRTVRREWRLPKLREADPLIAAARALVDAGALRPSPSRAGPTSGRARGDYLVSPYLLTDGASDEWCRSY